MTSPLYPPRRPAWPRTVLALAAATCLATGASAAASRHAWTDWFSDTGGVDGLITFADEALNVRYRGPYHSAVLTAPFQEMGSATFTNSVIANAPPNTDVINLQGGPGQGEISFGQALINPVMSLLSLGLRTGDNRFFPAEMVFADGVEFEILNSSGSVYGYGGPLTKSGQTLRGLESAGSIRFIGAYHRIAWTTPLQEREFSTGPIGGSWHINVGAPCDSIDIGRGPLLNAATVFKGCTATNTAAAWRQDAALQVLGSWRNEGRHTLAADLTLGATATYANRGQVLVEAGRLLDAGAASYTDLGSTQVMGTLNLHSASLQLAGLLQVKAGGRLNVTGSGFASLGGDIRISGEGAAMRVLAPATAYGAITLGEQATFELGTGMPLQLTASGRLSVDGSGAFLINNGELTLLAGAQINLTAGQARNNGLLQADRGAQLYVNSGSLYNAAGAHLVSSDQVSAGGYAVPASLVNAGRMALAEHGLLSVFNHGSFEQRASGLLVGAAGSMVEVTAGGRAELAGRTVLNGSLLIETGGRVEVVGGGTFTQRMQAGATGINRGELINAGAMALGGTVGASDWDNEGVLTNHNFVLVEVGTTLANTGTVVNHAFMQVDGVLAMYPGSQFVQYSGDLTINGTLAGGRIVSGDPLVIANGALRGQGTIAGDVVMQGGVAGPGNSPGTLRVLGDMVLGSGSTLVLEMAPDGRHDLLQVEGWLNIDAGATVRLSFLGGAPDIDQTFGLLSVGEGSPSFGAAGLLIDHPSLQPSHYNNGRTLALAFQEASAQRVDRPFEAAATFEAGQAYYADSDLGHYGQVVVAGTLGLRAPAVLSAHQAEVAPGGRLLNSGSLTIFTPLLNQGETVNRGQLATAGLDNRGQFINRATLTIGSGIGSPDGHLANHGRLVNGPGAILRAGSVRQAAGELWVDGELGAVLTQVQGGVLGGTGVLHGAVQIDDSALDSAGLPVGTGLRPGLGRPDGSQALRFSGPVHLGWAYQGVTVEIDIASAESFGQLHFLDALTVDAGSRLKIVLLDGFEPAQALSLTVLRYNTDLTGFQDLAKLLGQPEVWQRGAAGDLPWTGGSWDFAWHSDHIDLLLTPAPVPEPAAAGLLAAGLALLQGLAWRRRRASTAAMPIAATPTR